MTEWIEIPNVSLSNNDARQVAAVNSICSETEQRGSLLERQLGRNSILDTFPETNSIVASRIALLNETGLSQSCEEPCKYASSNHIRMWNAIEVFSLGINKERKKRWKKSRLVNASN